MLMICFISEITINGLWDMAPLKLFVKGKAKSPIKGLDHIPSQHLRIHKDGFRVQQQIGTETVWFAIYGKNKVDEKPVDVHCKSGEIYPYNSLRPDERANELTHLDGSIYTQISILWITKS